MEAGRRRSAAAAGGRSSGFVGSMETIKERRSGKQRVVEAKKSVEKWWKGSETKRKRRVAKYKFYAVEGKLKRSITKGFQWIKKRCAKIIYGF
ncbi:hypothetical protein SDJN03_17177, partial [Cucurbita argyrosperma subsp. sororia]